MKRYTVHSKDKVVRKITGWVADFGENSGVEGIVKNGIHVIKYNVNNVSFIGKSAKHLANFFKDTYSFKITVK